MRSRSSSSSLFERPLVEATLERSSMTRALCLHNSACDSAFRFRTRLTPKLGLDIQADFSNVRFLLNIVFSSSFKHVRVSACDSAFSFRIRLIPRLEFGVQVDRLKTSSSSCNIVSWYTVHSCSAFSQFFNIAIDFLLCFRCGGEHNGSRQSHG